MFEKIIDRIKEYDTIVIFGHRNPDGDCYGSQIALRETIKAAYPNKKVYATGSGLKRFFELIGEMDEVDDETIKNALAIIVDGNDLPRMEDERVYNAKAWAKLDHHVDTGTYNEGPFVVDEDASSCCEIIFDMIEEANFPINKTVANALYLGIMTDTGRFQYVQNYVKCFEQSSKLVKLGAEPEAINKIFNMAYETSMIFKGYVFTHYKKTEKGVIYLELNQPTLKKYGLTASKAGNMVNLLANIKWLPIWAFFCENEDGSLHAEFRSADVPVQPIAAKYGGGGHMHAAGVTMPKYNKETIDLFLNDFDELLSGEY